MSRIFSSVSKSLVLPCRQCSLAALALAMAAAGLAGCAAPVAPPAPPARDVFAETMMKYAASVSDGLSKMGAVEGMKKVQDIKPLSTAPVMVALPLVSVVEAPSRTITRAATPGYLRSVPQPRYVTPAALTQPAAQNATMVTVVVNTNGPVPGSVYQPQPAAIPQISSIPEGLERRLSVPWSTDATATGYTESLESLVAQICREVGWTKGRSTGIPLSPIPVTVTTADQTAYELLTDIGNYIGRSAYLMVSPETRTISIRYPVR